MGERALTLAEDSIRNYSTNPFESSDDEVEIRLGESSISTVQDIWKNQLRNPFDIIEEQMEIKQIGEDALIVAHDVSTNYAKNPFEILDEEDEGRLKYLGTDALNIAQTAARNIEATKQQHSENKEDIDNVFNNLIDTADLENPLIEVSM